MINRLLTKALLSGYNLSQRGRLFRLSQAVRKKNNSREPISQMEVNSYLQKWGYEPDIIKAPSMNKQDIGEHTRKLDADRVYRFFLTGGSTGEPLKIPHSKQRALLRTASILYYNEIGGYRPGDRFLFIRSKPKSELFQLLRNEILFVPDDLSRDKIEKTVKTLISKKVRVLIGYPSVIYEMAAYLEKTPEQRNKHSIRSFISNSEPFDPERAEYIRQVLQCQVIDRYSNEENGVIAQQRAFGGEYLVDRYNLFVEVVDPITLKPVPEGETGKVLVTDIASDLIPMIRYDTGDFATAAEYRNGQLWSLKQIVGRVVDRFYTTSGKPFSPLMLGPYIRLPLTNLGLHVQFQFSQLTTHTYRLQLKTQKTEIPEKNLDEVINGLKTVLGNDARIEVKFVEDIKALPSGKRPLYRNEMKNQNQAGRQ